jgi:hypothetical protein
MVAGIDVSMPPWFEKLFLSRGHRIDLRIPIVDLSLVCYIVSVEILLFIIGLALAELDR